MAEGQPSGQEQQPAGEARPEWDERLRAGGYRITRQRRAVLAALDDLSHATPEEILAHVQRDRAEMNLSTVYRTLEVLSEVGLVTHAHLGHGAPTYHSVSGDPHIHLVCRGCGAIRSAPPDVAEPLADELLAGYGFATDLTHLALHGLCAACRAAGATGSHRVDPALEQP